MKTSLEGLRNAIKKSQSSQQQMATFKVYCDDKNIPAQKAKPSLDVSTRWNSTFDMIETSLPYMSAFEAWSQNSVSAPPSVDMFDKLDIEDLHSFLKPLKEMTLEVSTHASVTMQNGLTYIYALKKQLDELSAVTTKLQTAKIAMIEKFNKYFDLNIPTVNLTFYLVASIFDPSCKFATVRKLLPEESDSIMNKIVSIYATNYKFLELTQNLSTASTFTESSNKYAAFLGICSPHHDDRSELEVYLSEAAQPCQDVVAFWKVNSQKFPTLSKMAFDFLTVQLSSVASEFAFSLSGRIIDDYRSRLSADSLEMLMQLKSWLKTRNLTNNI
jgi:hypothetical protein